MKVRRPKQKQGAAFARLSRVPAQRREAADLKSVAVNLRRSQGGEGAGGDDSPTEGLLSEALLLQLSEETTAGCPRSAEQSAEAVFPSYRPSNLQRPPSAGGCEKHGGQNTSRRRRRKQRRDSEQQNSDGENKRHRASIPPEGGRSAASA